MARSPFLVLSDFWHKGVLVEAGTVLHLFEAEAKYLAHALMPTPAEPVAPAAEVVEPVAEVKARVVEIIEKVGRKAKANADEA
jgi:hypothetical protein